MWASMESNDIITQVFSYKTNAFEEVRHARIDTCEDVCRELCRRWRFRPLVQLLFGLRNHKTKLWLGCNRQLVEGEQYEFRIRFKVSSRKTLCNFIVWIANFSLICIARFRKLKICANMMKAVMQWVQLGVDTAKKEKSSLF